MANKRQIKRLKKLIHFLEEVVHPTKFDLNDWVARRSFAIFKEADPFEMAKNPSEESCNTTACVVGWLPHLFPRQAKWVCTSMGNWHVSPYGGEQSTQASYRVLGKEGKLFTKITGIKASDKIIYLESNQYLENYSSDNPSPKEVADRIREVAAEEGIELGDDF